jgi:hypothetical protein
LSPCPATSLSRRAHTIGQSILAVKLQYSTTPATQRLLPGCACRRQTKLLAHGYASAIWGGRSSADTIGYLAAERLPEIDNVTSLSLFVWTSNGDNEAWHGSFQDACSIDICIH